MAVNVDEDSTHLDDAIDEVLDAIVAKCDAGVKATVAPIAFFASFDDALRAKCNTIWEDRKSRLSGKIAFISRIGDLKLVKDGVHLTDASAKRFFEHVTEASLAYFGSSSASRGEVMDLTESNKSDSEMDSETAFDRTLTHSFKRSRKRPAADPFVRREEFESLRGEMNTRFDNVVFTSARHSEDIDFVLNQNNLHKLVIHGLQVEDLYKSEDRKERVTLLKEAFKTIKLEIMKEHQTRNKDQPKLNIPDPVFLKHLNERLRGPLDERPIKQMVEVAFEKAQDATGLRDAYAQLNKVWRKEKLIPDVFKGIFINPSHTQRTRVRVEVLKALSGVINATRKKEDGASWVVQHLSRPVLKVTFGKDSIPKTYTYADALKWAAGKYPLGDQDLLEAYRIAGSSFGATMENHFIVLKGGGRNTQPLGRSTAKKPRNK